MAKSTEEGLLPEGQVAGLGHCRPAATASSEAECSGKVGSAVWSARGGRPGSFLARSAL